MNQKRRSLIFVEGLDGMGWFAIKERYEYVEKLYRAIEGANGKTVREFKRMLPPGEFESLHCWMANDGVGIYFDEERYYFTDQGTVVKLPEYYEYIVRADDKFTTDMLPDYDGGGYPPFLKPEQEEFLPTEFCQEFGIDTPSFLDGNWWEFPINRIEEMKMFLDSRGFSVFELEGPSYDQLFVYCNS